MLTAAAALHAANIPRKAPDFAIAPTNGQSIALSQYRGKVVALVFILTTCPHCQGAIRCLSEDQNEFGRAAFKRSDRRLRRRRGPLCRGFFVNSTRRFRWDTTS